MAAASQNPEHGPGGPPALVPGLRWRRVFPGEERQLGELRRWLESLLPVSPARDSVATVATEFGCNAIRHTASGRGGWFAVEVTCYAPVVRVTVADSGAQTGPRVVDDPAAERGRGLLVVRELALRTGVCGDERGRLMWADISWQGVSAATMPVASPDPYEAAIRDGEATLARSFAGIPAWFGRSTLKWWALAGPGVLVTAESAGELAGLLHRMLDAPPGSPPTPDATPGDSGGASALRWVWRPGLHPARTASAAVAGLLTT
jgi:serine/threonine-protein kinase RsbW